MALEKDVRSAGSRSFKMRAAGFREFDCRSGLKPFGNTLVTDVRAPTKYREGYKIERKCNKIEQVP